MGEPARRFEVVRREHAADRIYDQLANAIMKGELAAGTPLPPERTLSDEFGVSRTIVRQAVHRLADVGLVKVKQGGATIVQDTSRTTDVRVTELRYRIGPANEKQKREIVERRFFEGYALISLASFRHDPDVIRAMLGRVQAFPTLDEEASLQLERDVWTCLAESSENTLYISQSDWWNKLVAERKGEPSEGSIPPPFRLPFYTELLTRIIEKRDAPAFYIDTIRPLVFGPLPVPG